MKLKPSGLSGDQLQLSDDQLHLDGFFAFRAFSKLLMETLKTRLSVALLVHVVARFSSMCSASAGLDAGRAAATARRVIGARMFFMVDLYKLMC